MNQNEGAEGQDGVKMGQLPPRGRGAIPHIGIAPNAAPKTAGMGQTKTDPLAHPNVVKIPLDAVQTETLANLGSVFVAIGRASYPGDPSRMQLLCLPVPLEVARAAESVAQGKARAAKIKATPKP